MLIRMDKLANLLRESAYLVNKKQYGLLQKYLKDYPEYIMQKRGDLYYLTSAIKIYSLQTNPKMLMFDFREILK
jgi:hypothetical protein